MNENNPKTWVWDMTQEWGELQPNLYHQPSAWSDFYEAVLEVYEADLPEDSYFGGLVEEVKQACDNRDIMDLHHAWNSILDWSIGTNVKIKDGMNDEED